MSGLTNATQKIATVGLRAAKDLGDISTHKPKESKIKKSYSRGKKFVKSLAKLSSFGGSS